MMQMLNEAGCDVDSEREADESNLVFFEYKPVMNLMNDNSWLHKKTKAIKSVAPLLKFLNQESLQSNFYAT